MGARPNFMKIAPFVKAIKEYNNSSSEKINHILVHTGQHYDDRMSDSFFRQLDIPEADIHLGIGSGSHAEQVGKTMIEFEKVVKNEQPDWVVVVGDVNAILACSVTAKKEKIKCCHIEAGLRSKDISMPEEINRLVADRLSDLLLTPDVISLENLRMEGTPENKIKLVGNIMIDTLESNREKAENLSIKSILIENIINSENTDIDNISEPRYALLTLHRPSNVDNEKILKRFVRFIIEEVCPEVTLMWSLHPRTIKMLNKFGLYKKLLKTSNLVLLEPLGYLEMLKLNMNAKLVLTDSGGLQEECTVLGTPCLTLRWNTERPITLSEHGGVSVLVGNNVELIREEFFSALRKPRTHFRPVLWDGHAAERCLSAILEYNQE